jgi:hypothetical protein
MKRLIIIILAIGPAVVWAQNNGDKTDANGYTFTFQGTSTGFADIGWVPGCDGDNAVKAITHDGSTVGEYTITTDGEQNYWEHVELNLVDATGLSAVDIDLSEESSQWIEVTISADQDAEVLFMLSDKTTVDLVNGWEVVADNNPAILYDYVVEDGEITVSNNTDSYTGTDAANGNLDWSVFELDDGSTSGLVIDSTAIAEVWVYYRAKDVNTNCGAGIHNVAGTLTIKRIVIGGYCVGNSKADVRSEAAFDTYPNPANAIVNFSEELEEVKVYNVDGELVLTEKAVSSINTSSFEPGLYMLSTSKGYKMISIN